MHNYKFLPLALLTDLPPTAIPAEPERSPVPSHHPVAIRLTNQPVGTSHYLALVDTQSQHPAITTLFVTPSWPAPDAKPGIPADRRIVTLSHPMPLSEVL